MSEKLYLDEDFRTLAKTYPADVSAIGVTTLIDYVEAVEAENARLTAELEELRERTRWIPCKEKMPEVDKRVEFFGGFEQTTYIGYYREHTTQWESENGGFWHGKNFSFITHWMPLPEPPEEEKC